MKDNKGKDNTLGRRIAQLRNACGLTQNELASDLYISRSGVSNYERGSRTPDVAMLQKLCNRFDVSMNFLLGNYSMFEENDTITKAESEIKQYLKDGKLDLSDAPPLVRIFIVEFYLYLAHRYR